MDNPAKEVIKNWKENKGFPYYPEDRKWRDDEFNKLTSFNRDTLLDTPNKIIGQATHGLSLAWAYMHHAWGIKCGKMRTPMEIWEDEEHLKIGINKILSGTFFTQKEHYEITDSDMRAMLRRYSGTQMVSNFRPTAAAALYDVFVDKEVFKNVSHFAPAFVIYFLAPIWLEATHEVMDVIKRIANAYMIIVGFRHFVNAISTFDHRDCQYHLLFLTMFPL